MWHITTHPNLALIKYWGKQANGKNIAASSSIGISLNELSTQTKAHYFTDTGIDLLTVDTVDVTVHARHFFDAVRDKFHINGYWHMHSHNNFPRNSGLASSSSGYAAAAFACISSAELPYDDMPKISSIARIGSGSAARAVYGGVCVWHAGTHAAQPYPVDTQWLDTLRIVVVEISKQTKPISSRDAMIHVMKTSPYYQSWLENSKKNFSAALEAIELCDIEQLGLTMQTNFMSMFATMHSASPPVLYWHEQSITVLKMCKQLRDEGYIAWETMDAGPQVKILTVEHDSLIIQNYLHNLNITTHISKVGAPPQIIQTSL